MLVYILYVVFIDCLQIVMQYIGVELYSLSLSKLKVRYSDLLYVIVFKVHRTNFLISIVGDKCLDVVLTWYTLTVW